MLPLSVFYYAMLENPKPANKYWRLITLYLVATIGLKFLYQLPLICSSPVFSVLSCNDVEISREVLVRRLDYIIGLQKYTGGASYPKDMGIFRGIMWDIALLVLLVYLKAYLVKTGQFHFVISDEDIHSTPRFKCAFQDLSLREKEQLKETKDFNQKIYNNYNFFQKAVYNIKQFEKKTRNFLIKLLPRYMQKT